MRKKSIDYNAVFQPIRGASEITGLSQRFIRDGCKSGWIPHILCGTDYRVNMPLFLKQLNTNCEGSGVTV